MFNIKEGILSSRLAQKKVRVFEDHEAGLLEECFCFCGSDNSQLVSEIDRYGFYYPLVICKCCGLLRANPRRTQESYRRFYASQYRDIYEEADKPIDELFQYRMEQGQKQYEYFMKLIDLPDKAVIFEIGCDFGTMLLPFAQAGHQVYGCDYGAAHITYGRSKTGLKNLFIGNLENLRQTNQKADFMILRHVLEHFLDLEKELKTIRSLMKPQGLIYVSLPGTFWWIKNRCGGNIIGLLQSAHTYQFSLMSLTYMMECCGFELVSGNEEVESIFRLSNKIRDKKDIPVGEFEKVLKHLQHSESKYLPKFYLGRVLEFFGLKKVLKKVING